jgi:hypothetical protein
MLYYKRAVAYTLLQPWVAPPSTAGPRMARADRLAGGLTATNFNRAVWLNPHMDSYVMVTMTVIVMLSLAGMAVLVAKPRQVSVLAVKPVHG